MMPDHQPLVSVLMTVYNREKYLGTAIESILQNKYTHFELIIVDDCSTDSSLQIAQTYAAKDNRIKVFANEKNLTDYPNRNKAAAYAKGKYLKYLDSDDLLYPYGLCMLVHRMEQFPEAGLGLCKRGWVERPFPILLTPLESYRESFLNRRELFSNAPTSTIIKRSVFEALGGFTGLNQIGDTEFWMMIAAQYHILLIEGDVTWNRELKDSEKYKDSEKVKHQLRMRVKLAALTRKDCPLNEKERAAAINILKTAGSSNLRARLVKKIKSKIKR